EGQSIHFIFIRITQPFAMLLFSLLFMPFIYSDQQTRSCLSCASETLRSRWFLTGLPTKALGESQFISACDAATANNIPREPCAGPCFTYIFDDPDNRGESTTHLIVRGCHDTMVGVISDRLTSGGTQNGLFCEYDSSYSRPDSRGKMVTTRTLVEYCGTRDDGCNKRSQFPTGTNDVCSGSQYNSTINGSPLYCYECRKDDWNCNDNRCYKKYCTKSVVELSKGYTIQKTCSNVNILGIDNACAYSDVVNTAGDISVNMKYTSCFCKDQQYCNSSPSLLSSLLFSLTPL
ncbi:hypothetical protein PFISCL1PPCAC_26806, partial [Pristionchus fissidentatus]